MLSHHLLSVLPRFLIGWAVMAASAATEFEGFISAELIQGTNRTSLRYTVHPDALRIEVAAAERPQPINLLNRKSGTLTLLFPHNRTFMRLPPGREDAPASGPGAFPAPWRPGNLPPGSVPPMLALGERFSLRATGQETNFSGVACAQYQATSESETVEVWATDRLLPYQPYLRGQPAGFGPRGLTEQWPIELKRRGLFPLQASLRPRNGVASVQLKVHSVTAAKLTPQDLLTLQPPPGYVEIHALPSESQRPFSGAHQ